MGCTSSSSFKLGTFAVGESVKTVFGNGKITAFREVDQVYVVHLDEWKLGKLFYCFL